MIQHVIHKNYSLFHNLEDERKRGARMKKIFVLLQTALFIALASFAYAQSLADVADKEKERRQEVKNDKVITDEQAAKYRSQPSPINASDQPAADKPDAEKNAPDSHAGPQTGKSGPARRNNTPHHSCWKGHVCALHCKRLFILVRSLPPRQGGPCQLAGPMPPEPRQLD